MAAIVSMVEYKTSAIPHGSCCDGCSYYEYKGADYLLKSPEMIKRVCKSLRTDKDNRFIRCPYRAGCSLEDCVCDGQPVCRVDRVACRYINYADDNEETLLFDKVKQCGINMS